jgi:hypothetical protein
MMLIFSVFAVCGEGLPGAGSRAEAVEHAAFCLRGREVSSSAVVDVVHQSVEACLGARRVVAEVAKAVLVAMLVEASMMDVSLELVQGRGCGACCLLSTRQGGIHHRCV